MENTIEKIKLEAKRWHDGFNTYHTVQIYVNGHVLATSEMTYGYERAYEQTALAILQSLGLAEKEYRRGINSWAYDNEIMLTSSHVDVKSENQLHKIDPELTITHTTPKFEFTAEKEVSRLVERAKINWERNNGGRDTWSLWYNKAEEVVAVLPIKFDYPGLYPTFEVGRTEYSIVNAVKSLTGFWA